MNWLSEAINILILSPPSYSIILSRPRFRLISYHWLLLFRDNFGPIARHVLAAILLAVNCLCTTEDFSDLSEHPPWEGHSSRLAFYVFIWLLVRKQEMSWLPLAHYFPCRLLESTTGAYSMAEDLNPLSTELWSSLFNSFGYKFHHPINSHVHKLLYRSKAFQALVSRCPSKYISSRGSNCWQWRNKQVRYVNPVRVKVWLFFSFFSFSRRITKSGLAGIYPSEGHERDSSHSTGLWHVHLGIRLAEFNMGYS